jgi:large subunit ribosomal protein L24
MSMRKLKKDDQVVVITGKDKGKRGAIQRVLDDNRVLISGVNIVKKHTKANPQLGIQGGIVEREASIEVSNVAIYNPKTNKADRVGFKDQDGKKVRVYKSSGDVIGA